MTKPPNLRVAALLYDGLCTFEFGIVAEIFALRRPELGIEWYDFVACAEHHRPLHSNGHVRIIPEAGLEALKGAGTIVIPGWPTDGATPSQALADGLLDAHARGARIVTICSGVFLPASIGLLAGRTVTTHWFYVDRFRELFPSIRLKPDVLYVDDGDILTSAGSAAGIDLLLHLVRRDFGAGIANRVARRMVVQPHREGGQAQFVIRPVAVSRNSRLAPLLDRIRERPGECWSIARMAREAAMSQRTFIRRFKEALGSNPGDWLIQIRTDAARDLLEAGAPSIEEVARVAGFGSVAALRHHFRRLIGVTPASYRARFSRIAAV